MARPRSFCTDTALTTALEVFWTKGYEATSITDLTEAMGIQRGSLYQAFGDKKSLFLAALDQYLCEGRTKYGAALTEGENAAAGIEAWLHMVMTGCPSGRGCFAVNATTELSGQDSDVERVVSAHWSALEELLAGAIERGQSASEIRSDVAPAALARAIIAAVAGAQVLAKQGAALQGDTSAGGAAVATTVAALLRA